jgi:hypothetical protein
MQSSAQGTAPAEERKAAPPPDPRTQQIEQLRRELDDLRALVTTLEAQAAQNEQLVNQVTALNEQMAALRTQIADAQAAAAERAAQVDASVATLIGIQQQLVFGDTTEVDDSLRAAESALGAVARSHIEAARNALTNKDAANARWYLSQAIYEAQQQR